MQTRGGTCLQRCLENVKRERRYPAGDTCHRTCGSEECRLLLRPEPSLGDGAPGIQARRDKQ